MNYKNIIDNMTLEEKASLCVGKDLWHTNEIQRLNIPSIMMSDGPNGLRVEITNKRKKDLETPESKVAVCFPTESTMANSWNKDLVYKVGKAIGKEAKKEQVNILLGPGVNIKRSPLCGRNFEYFSEDPYLAGSLGVAYVKGAQENNIGVCVKHFAANNQEYNRRLINVVVDERTLNEIYLKAFEMIVKEAKPASIMSAYNKINGKYCSDNKELINDTLYNKWNFNGIVITDWSAEDNRVEGIKAGTAIEMPGDRANIKEQIVEAVKNGGLDENTLNEVVDKILTSIYKLVENSNENNISKNILEENHNIALEVAEDSIVLLKNEDDILPIKNKKIALIGDFAKIPRYQGAGSSKVNSYKLGCAYEYFEKLGYEIDYAKGYGRGEDDNNILLEEAIKTASNSDIVIIFAGLTEVEEAEGLDRNTLSIQKIQNKLIEEISKVNKNIVVVLSNGAPITMPWKNKVKGIVTGYLGGEAGAEAMVNCLTGKINPSGKLAETYPLKLEDTPCYNNFPGSDIIVEYKEAIYVGYRYYDKINKEVLFPFGYGLSYTNFEYSDLEINKDGNNIKIKFKVENTGNVKGKEIAQVYVAFENVNSFRPAKELKAFEKVMIEPGEKKEITINLKGDDLSYYDIDKKGWRVEEGSYKILIGKSSRDIVLEGVVNINRENTTMEITRNPKCLIEVPNCYIEGNIKEASDDDFEKITKEKLPDRILKIEDISDSNSIEQIRQTKVGNYIYEKEIKRANKYFEEQNVDLGYRIIKRIQKPLRRFYERSGAVITKQMVDELIKVAKNNEEKYDLDFMKIYFDDSINK